MANSGDVIEHPVTGEKFTFLETAQDTGGEYSRYEVRVSPHGFVAAPHVHPRIEETFEIRAGTWAFVVDGVESRVGPGEGATIPVGTPHAWWNAGDEEGVAIVEFRPALKADEFFESFFGLARDGKVSPKTGLPNLLWLAAIFRSYHRDFAYIARPPLAVQRAIFTPLAAVARLLGYRMPYPYPYHRSRGSKTRLGGAPVSEPSSLDHEGGIPTVSSGTKYQHSVVIAAPVERVFAFAADFENDPRWRAEVRRMRYASERPVRVGTRAVETARVLGRELETETVVTAYEPNRRVAAKSVSGPVPIVGSRDFEAVPGGTRFTYTLETDVSDVPLFRLIGPLLARWYRGRIEGYLRTLKRILESQASSSKAA